MVCGRYWVLNIPPLLGGHWILNIPPGWDCRVLGIKCPLWVCEQIVAEGGGGKGIRLELFKALAGLKIPKICLCRHVVFSVPAGGCRGQGGEGGVLLHPDLGKGQDLRFIRSRG